MGITIEELRAELAPIRAELSQMKGQLDGLPAIRAQLDGLPVIGRSIDVLQHDVRALRAAFNDFAKTQVTTGEIEALHFDLDRLQTENRELATRIATLERLIRERS